MIANCCIKALYDYNLKACQKHIIEVICAPLLTKEPCAAKSEKEIEQKTVIVLIFSKKIY